MINDYFKNLLKAMDELNKADKKLRKDGIDLFDKDRIRLDEAFKLISKAHSGLVTKKYK